MTLFLLSLASLFTLKGIPSWKIKYVVTLVLWYVWFNLRENRGGKGILSREEVVWRVITDGLDWVDKDIVDFLVRIPGRAVEPMLHAWLLLTFLSERMYFISGVCVLYPLPSSTVLNISNAI